MAAVDIPVAGGHAADAHGDPHANYLKANRGIGSWLTTLDHKRIGLMYLTMVCLAFLVGGIFALLVRLELFTRGKTIVDGETYNRFFTLHGAVMVFLFIIPSVPAAMGNFFLPIMIGAKDVAFPRLNLLSFYIYLVGVVILLTSIVMGSVDTGWTFYTPYSVQTSSSVISMTLGVFVLGFSSILTGLNFLVTVHTMRAPGVTWSRMPLFVWGMYATALMQVLATPVLAITLLLLCAERFFGIGIFDPKLGGDPVLFQHFFWFYSHPAVYIMIVPGMAINSELIATFSRRAVFGQFAVAMSSIGLALLGFLVWGHHMFAAGMSEFATMLFSALTFLVAIPSGVKVFNWTATMYKGSILWASPMLYAMAFIFLFTIGGLTGLFLGTLSVDIHLTDTYFVVAHFHYVMMGGTVIAFLGGLLYWWPKMTGKMHDEAKAKVGFWFVFVGFNTVFIPQFIMGSRGMPRRYYDYLPQFEPFHKASTIGSWILATGLFITAYTLLEALVKGKKAPPQSLGSAGYEWMTDTPPCLANFHETPVMTRGPYDYHLATPEELATGWDEVEKKDDMANVTESAHGHGEGGHAHPHPSFLQHHFDTPAQQFNASKLGMWVFIATEILMFGGLFCAYAIWRGLEPDIFDQAHHFLNKIMGATNTVVLLFSSLTAALAVRAAQTGKRNLTSIYLVVTIVCACIFLVVKYFEYSHKFHLGLLPGHCFGHPGLSASIQNGEEVGTCLRVNADVSSVMPQWVKAVDEEGRTTLLSPRANMFFGLYFVMTGLHGLHVIIGMSILVWVLYKNVKGQFSPQYFTPVDLGALYWHLVDLVWIYLFPLLYLVGKPE